MRTRRISGESFFVNYFDAMKQKAFFHSFLFTLAFLLYQYSLSSVIISPNQILRPLLVLWAGLFILVFPAYWLTNNREWAGILLSVIALGFFTSLAIFFAFGLVSITGILIWVVISLLRKRGIHVEQINLLLIYISLLLVIIISVFRVILPLSNIPWSYYENIVINSGRPPVPALLIPDTRPDVYYIVLDGYGRADILQELYGFDNTEFIEDLSNKGFVVPKNIHSNYPKTALSVSSTLNMNYIETIAPGLQDSFYWWLMSPLIEHSEVQTFFEQAGYKTVSIATDWSITDNTTTDYYFKPYPVHLNSFEEFLLASTPLGILHFVLDKVAFIPSMDTHRQLVIYNFETLSKMSEIEGPKFIFAHILSPHPPFVFDSGGNPINTNNPFTFNDANDFHGTQEQYRQEYTGQVEFVNQRLERMVDSILKNSDTPPIIILQADHGPGMLTDFRSAENTCIKERFSPFAAYYLPGLDADVIPQDITPVNLFRIIFNQYFSTDFPMLDNRYYYFLDTVYIYRKVDVSSRINLSCNSHP
jgi:hypothetical protein